MGVNKVIFYGETLIDMSQVTVTPETLGKGKTALDARGELITGTLESDSVETVLVTIVPVLYALNLHTQINYTNINQEFVSMPLTSGSTITVLKNTVFSIQSVVHLTSSNMKLTSIGDNNTQHYWFRADGDLSIQVYVYAG